jgi:tetratricopeptide (TPR) repeat protein
LSPNTLKISTTLLSRHERGDTLTRERVDALVAPLDVAPEAVEVLLFAHRLIFPAPPEEGSSSSSALTPDERRRIDRAALAAGWTAAEEVRAELIRRKKEEKLAAARHEAREAWERLKSATPQERRDLIETFPEFQSVALVARVCEASVRAAAHRAEDALALAELALTIAERVSESRRSRAEGFCWAHLGNARRVATDFDKAEEAFARAWQFWQAGGGSEPELLPEWRLLDLEASLRREQLRFPGALALLDQAHAACGSDPVAVARILLKKQNVLERSRPWSKRPPGWKPQEIPFYSSRSVSTGPSTSAIWNDGRMQRSCCPGWSKRRRSGVTSWS